ncbi:hypothetical protein Tco_0972129 [Tanacetum coccineum]
MGRGTWYYSLGVSSIVDAFVRSEDLVGFTPRRRIGFRMELVQGATPICEGSCRLTSLERQEVWNDCRSCKVRVGSNGNLLWEASVLLGRKKGGVHGDDVAKTVFRMRNGHVEVYGYAFWVNQCTSGFHGVNEPGGVRVAREDDRGVSEGREDVREVFQQRGSGAKRKLSRCGRNQMGNEPILALPEGADDFVVYYDARSKDLEACLEKGEGDCLYVATTEEAYTTKYSIHPGADTMLCGFRLTNRWLSMKKDIASCGSKYLAYSEVVVEYQGSSRLLLQLELPEYKWERITKDIVVKLPSDKYGRFWRLWVVEGLTLERCSTFGKKDKLEPSYVGPFEILGWIGPIVRLKIYVLWAEYRKLDWEFLFDELRVKIRWDSKSGPELTWERKDQMRSRELKRNGNVMVVNC